MAIGSLRQEDEDDDINSNGSDSGSHQSELARAELEDDEPFQQQQGGGEGGADSQRPAVPTSTSRTVFASLLEYLAAILLRNLKLTVTGLCLRFVEVWNESALRAALLVAFTPLTHSILEPPPRPPNTHIHRCTSLLKPT